MRLRFNPTKSDSRRRRIMPIEQALVWAYAEELAQVPKGTTDAEFHATHPMWNLRIDNSLSSYDEAALRYMAHPNAIEIAKAVEKLNGTELLDEADIALDEPILGASLDMIEREKLALQAAKDRVQNIIVVNARLSSLPDLPDARRCYPIRSANGEVIVRREMTFTQNTVAGGKVSYLDHELVSASSRAKPSRGRYPQGAVCPVIWLPDWPILLRERAEYFMWRLGIRALARSLQNLDFIAVQSSRLALRPWAKENGT